MVLLSLCSSWEKHGAECGGGHRQCVPPDKFSLPKPVMCLSLSLSLFLCLRTSALPLCVQNSQGQQPRARPFDMCVCCLIPFCVARAASPSAKYVMLHLGLPWDGSLTPLGFTCVFLYVSVGMGGFHRFAGLY